MRVFVSLSRELLIRMPTKTASMVGAAAFTVRRQANPSFVSPLTIHRSQIYADMTLEDFAKNLTIFQEEDLR